MRLLLVVTRGEIVGGGTATAQFLKVVRTGRGGGDEGGKQGSQHRLFTKALLFGQVAGGTDPLRVRAVSVTLQSLIEDTLRKPWRAIAESTPADVSPPGSP